MTDESTFNPDDRSMRRELSARRAARLAVYQRPVPRDIQQALALEDATEATRRAICAVIDASDCDDGVGGPAERDLRGLALGARAAQGAGVNAAIQRAQSLTAYHVDGVRWPRVRYGQEAVDMDASAHPCNDCGVAAGQYHVTCCQFEECPCCHDQVISCGCEHWPTLIGADDMTPRH